MRVPFFGLVFFFENDGLLDTRYAVPGISARHQVCSISTRADAPQGTSLSFHVYFPSLICLVGLALQAVWCKHYAIPASTCTRMICAIFISFILSPAISVFFAARMPHPFPPPNPSPCFLLLISYRTYLLAFFSPRFCERTNKGPTATVPQHAPADARTGASASGAPHASDLAQKRDNAEGTKTKNP